MKNFIIFKITRTDFSCDDYCDIITDRYAEVTAELKEAAKKHGKEAVVTASFADHVACIIAADPLLEVEYMGELAADEREEYIAIARLLFSDIEDMGRGKEHTVRFLVKITRMAADTEITVQETAPCTHLQTALRAL